MGHPFPLKDIARQAGVGLATVDRVMNRRPGVRACTEQRIRQAIDELSRQTLEATVAGRRFVIDLVMDAPDRFSRAVQAALEAELPALLPMAFRIRAHLMETANAKELAATLHRVVRTGSHGVILKAPDLPPIGAAIRALASARIPTVTLVTDVPDSRRLLYVGMDNFAAGQTAAWLIANRLGPDAQEAVLVALSSHCFLGEEQREAGFRDALAQLAPQLQIVAIAEGRGMDRATESLTRAMLEQRSDITAVYSIGGGNRAIANAFRKAVRPCHIFIGHDLDVDNRSLLIEGVVSAVLHHDLRGDMRLACRAILQVHQVLPKTLPMPLSAVGIVTPFNLPVI